MIMITVVLSAAHKYTILDSLNDFVEGLEAAIQAGMEGYTLLTANDLILQAESIADLIEHDQELDHESLAFVSDALEASEDNAADLGLDDAAEEYADARRSVDAAWRVRF